MEELTPTEPIYVPEARVVINTSPEYYAEKKLEVRTASELGRIARDCDSYRTSTNRLSGYIESVEKYLKENYDELEEHADEIAKLLGFELSNTVEVEFDVTVRATLTIPMGTSVDDLSTYDFDLEISYNGRDEIEIEDTNIDINSIDERQVSQQVGRCGGDNHINKNTTHTQEKI